MNWTRPDGQCGSPATEQVVEHGLLLVQWELGIGQRRSELRRLLQGLADREELVLDALQLALGAGEVEDARWRSR